MRRKHEVVAGHRISCWDSDSKFADRYCVVYLDEEDELGKVPYVGMSERPFHPQGVGMHGEMPVRNVTYRGRGGVFDKRIEFADLPEDCRKLVLMDLSVEREDRTKPEKKELK
jgi:hypothetical protein